MIKKDNIVTVINKKLEAFNCQGIVVKTNGKNKKHPIVVLFEDGMHNHLFHFDIPKNERTKNFKESELKVNSEWKLEIRARRIFGDEFHSLRAQKKDSNPEKKCNAADFDSLIGCNGSNATKKALVNFSGTVCEIPTCDICFEKYNAHWIE